MAFIDAQALPDDSLLEADIVIIGGGMAGITIARQFIDSDRKVLVLEAGGRELDMAAQQFYVGSAVVSGPGNPDRMLDRYPAETRARVLGGSGMIWGGKCVPLDPADFEARDWIPYSGWPLGRRDLQPYYDRACDLLEIPRFDDGEAEANGALEAGPDFFSAPRCFSRLSGGVDRAAFDRFRTAFAEAPNIDVCLNANVMRLGLAQEGDRIDQLDVACLNGRRHRVRGRTVILAAGGIENVRLMLVSNDREPRGVGNRNDLVGRFFQAHVVYALNGDTEMAGAAVQISGQRDLTLYANPDRRAAHCVFATRLAGQKRLRTGNFTLTLVPGTGPEPPGDAGEETGAIGHLAAGVDGAASPGALLPCFMMAEHLPNPESRIVLGETRDALGMPRIHMAWTYSQADFDGLEASVAAFGDGIGASGTGRVCWPARRERLVAMGVASRHHMGTTRMHADPRQGVVDANARVHGLDNLYIAGSSVFPTSGIANPTLTLMALAIRLADHLKQGEGAGR